MPMMMLKPSSAWAAAASAGPTTGLKSWAWAFVEDAPTALSVFSPNGSFTNGEDDLGVEVDLVATYQLIEGMNLDIVGAYLFAGDAVSETGDNDDDPYEVGMRLSLSF
jgi:hypothetical protein